MTFRTLILLAGISALALPLEVAVAAARQKPEAGEKLVCKVRPRTGTRFGTKVCRTVSQWDQISEDSRRNMKDLVDRPQISVCGPSGCD